MHLHVEAVVMTPSGEGRSLELPGKVGPPQQPTKGAPALLGALKLGWIPSLKHCGSTLHPEVQRSAWRGIVGIPGSHSSCRAGPRDAPDWL